jgi:hypothetical protein
MKKLQTICSALFALCLLASALATPQFARDTKMTCGACHTHVPRLNSFGQSFYSGGFRVGSTKLRMAELVWIQATSETSAGSAMRPTHTFEDSAIASGGVIGKTTYHLMYFPISQDVEAYAIHPLTQRVSLSTGTISPISQFDPELEFSFEGAAVLAPEEFLDNEEISPFQLGEGVLAGRAVFGQISGLPYGEGWNVAATVPLSNGMEDIRGFAWAQPKGVLVEAYRRNGLNTVGVNYFTGRSRRFAAVLAQHKLGRFFFQAGAGLGRFQEVDVRAYSFAVDWSPRFSDSVGARVDVFQDRSSVTGFLSHIVGGGSSALSLRAEVRASQAESPQAKFIAAFRF